MTARPSPPGLSDPAVARRRRDLHGYAIIQDVARAYDGGVSLTASTLYAAIKRMLDAGLIAEVDAPAETRRRAAPLLPHHASGPQQVAQREAERLARTVAMARDKRLLPRQA